MKTSILLKTHILWSSLLWKRYNSLKWHFPKWQEKEIRENRLESAERASCLVRSVSFEYKGQAPETQLTWTHSILGHFTLLINHLCYVRFHCRCHPCYQWDAFVKGKFVLLIFNRIPQELIFNLGPCVCVLKLCVVHVLPVETQGYFQILNYIRIEHIMHELSQKSQPVFGCTGVQLCNASSKHNTNGPHTAICYYSPKSTNADWPTFFAFSGAFTDRVWVKFPS